MIIGDRLRALRIEKKFSQGEIEKRTGLLKCYLSRVECGHTVPNIETLEKWTRALEIPLYVLFYDGKEPPKTPKLPKRKRNDKTEWGNSPRDARDLAQFRRSLGRLKEHDQRLLLSVARKMANRANYRRRSERPD
jgi:transcriptional regulator with XRE-family HTH domain